jgi:glycosyltransferase involved in cell wall biosynthesis
VILQVLPALVTGGVERGAVDVAGAIVAAGGRAIVASNGGPMVREVEAAGAEHVQLPLHSKNPLVIAANAMRLAALIRARNVGLVHARSRAPAWSALAAARRTGTPFVTTFHGVYNGRSGPKRLYNAVMAKGDPVIAVSRFVADHVRTVYGVAPARIRTVQRGVDLERFHPRRIDPARVERLRREWRLPEGAPVVMLPARLTRWKGQLLLLAALARIGPACGVLVGSDQGRHDYRREIEATARSLGLAERVRIVGSCDDMPAAYAASDLVVSASTDPEAFGRVMAEAQAMGVPVVAAAHGAAPEIVRDGETGFLFPPGDVDGLAQTLVRALALAPEERRALVTCAAAGVCADFTKEVMCAATLAIYAEAIGRRARAPGAAAA